MANYLRISSLIFRQRLAVILEYRTNFIMRIVAGFISLLFMVTVWQGLRPDDFQGTLWQFYVIAGIVGAVTGEGFYRQMASDVNTGNLSFYLLQQYPYLGRITARLFADALINIGISILTIVVVGLFVRGTISISFVNLLLAIPFLIAGRLMGILINFLAGCVSFIWINPDAFYLVLDTVLFFFFGSMLPFWMLPPVWQKIFVLLPFRSVIATPTEVAVGITSYLIPISISTIIWLGILSFLSARVWKKVLVYYEAVGG